MTAPGPLHICCECELAVFIGLPCAFLTLLHHLCFFSSVRLSCPTSACGLLSWLIAFCSDMFDFCLLDSCSRRLGRVYLGNREDDENLGEIGGAKIMIYIHSMKEESVSVKNNRSPKRMWTCSKHITCNISKTMVYNLCFQAGNRLTFP